MKKAPSFIVVALLLASVTGIASAAKLTGKCDNSICMINVFDMEFEQKYVIPYSPQKFTVRPGANVTFINKGKDSHTATSGVSPRPDKRFDTGLLLPSKQWTIIINSTGEYPYFCIIHPWMNGIIIAIGEPISKPVIQHAPAPQPAPRQAPIVQPAPALAPAPAQPPSAQQPAPQPAPAPAPIIQPQPQPVPPPPPVSQAPQEPKLEPVQEVKQEQPAPKAEEPKPIVQSESVRTQTDNTLIFGGMAAVAAIVVTAVVLRKKA